MKLTTKTRYGVRAILELAECQHAGPVRLKEVAERQDISIKYLEQLMAILKSAGFVRSIRGSKGGYVLAKSANDIKLSDIFQALEGPVAPVECLESEDCCTRIADCTARLLWEEIQQAILNVLQSLTLEDLLNRAKVKGAVSYQI